jgi:uncharacterized protein YycO
VTGAMSVRRWARIAVAGVLVVALLSVVLLQIWPPATTALSIEEEALQPGDIIFVDLYSGWCHVGYWDHMALYVGEEPYAGVVEATYNGGICYTPLPAFLGRDYPAYLAVKRLGDVPGREQAVHRAIEYALAQVGNDFDFSATATIPLKVNGQNQHCAEVVWRAYKAAGIDLDSDDGPLLYPDDVYYSPRLGLVCT